MAEQTTDRERYQAGRRVLATMLGDAAAGRSADGMRELHPDFERLVMTHVMNDLYGREGLDLKTRLLCTIAALTVLGRGEQLAAHVERALGSGAATAEIEEVMLQMSAFGGFPATWDALSVLRDHEERQAQDG
jgi:4-carboxymuconolactone decarboxylase